jgi:hypothetical protein
MGIYYYAIGFDSYGKPACAGAYLSYDDAKQQAADQIPQIVEIVELPTSNMQRAKGMLKLKLSQMSHSLDIGMQPMRGYNP